MRADEAKVGEMVIVKERPAFGGIVQRWLIARCAFCGMGIGIGDLYADTNAGEACLNCVEPERPEVSGGIG